jgi:hypothetical protein
MEVSMHHYVFVYDLLTSSNINLLKVAVEWLLATMSDNQVH